MSIFAADMRPKGKEALVGEVEAVQKDASLLLVGSGYPKDYWIVMPDKRVVLWRFSTYGEPIKWGAENLPAWDCGNYQGECIGAIISQDGTISPR